MFDPRFWSVARIAGLLLVLGFAANLAGVLLFTFRDGMHGGAPPSPAYYIWERGLVLAAIIPTAIGLALLATRLLPAAEALALGGASGYLLGGALAIVAEALTIRLGYGQTYPLFVVYVVVAFLSQTALGGALLQAGLLAGWIGWATIVWNLAWLILLPILTPRDIYFPVLHHVAPLVIGVALLAGGG